MKLLCAEIDGSQRFFGVPTFFSYVIADRLYDLLFPDKTGINHIPRIEEPDFRLSFPFWEECREKAKSDKGNMRGKNWMAAVVIVLIWHISIYLVIKIITSFSVKGKQP